MMRAIASTVFIFALALVFSCGAKTTTDPAITAVRDDHQNLEELAARAELSVRAFERLAAETAAAQDLAGYKAALVSKLDFALNDIKALRLRIEGNMSVLEDADDNEEKFAELLRLSEFLKQTILLVDRILIAIDKLPQNGKVKT